MKTRIFCVMIIGLLLGCSGGDKKNPTTTSSDPPVYNTRGRVLTGVADFNQLLRQQAAKVILVNFYSAACSACRFEAPFLNRLLEEYGDRVSFLALSVDKVETLEEAETFAEALELELTVFLDKDQAIFKTLTQQFYPTTLFYGSDRTEDPLMVNGAIRYLDAKARLEALLAEQ